MADHPGMNDTLPHGTDTARRHHLAKGQPLCRLCAVVDALVQRGIDPLLVDELGRPAREVTVLVREVARRAP